MKNFLFIAILIITISLQVNAQPPRKGERIEALKIAYITQALKLTAEEAQNFWPVYNTYTQEIKTARLNIKEDELKFQEDVLNIKKKYKADFKRVLKDDFRVNQVYKVEGDFRIELQKELKKRMLQRQQRQQQ